FPNRTNVHFAQTLPEIQNPKSFRIPPEGEMSKANRDKIQNQIKVRTWERGAGITLACGSGACAVAVAGFLTNRTGRNVKINLVGGALEIEYHEDGIVFMTGPAAHVFDGEWNIA